MNKEFSIIIMLICFMLLITNASLFAQPFNNEQRLVGSWMHLHIEDATIIFNSDGTMSSDLYFGGFIPTHWAAAGDRLVMFIVGEDWDRNRATRFFHISSDGKTLIISTMPDQGGIGTAFKRK